MNSDRYPLRLFFLGSLPSYELRPWERPLAVIVSLLGVFVGVPLLGCAIIALVLWGDEGNWPWIVGGVGVAAFAAGKRRMP